MEVIEGDRLQHSTEHHFKLNCRCNTTDALRTACLPTTENAVIGASQPASQNHGPCSCSTVAPHLPGFNGFDGEDRHVFIVVCGYRETPQSSTCAGCFKLPDLAGGCCQAGRHRCDDTAPGVQPLVPPGPTADSPPLPPTQAGALALQALLTSSLTHLLLLTASLVLSHIQPPSLSLERLALGSSSWLKKSATGTR